MSYRSLILAVNIESYRKNIKRDSDPFRSPLRSYTEKKWYCIY